MDPKRGSEVIIREILAPALTASFEDLSRAARDAALVVTHRSGSPGPSSPSRCACHGSPRSWLHCRSSRRTIFPCFRRCRSRFTGRFSGWVPASLERIGVAKRLTVMDAAVVELRSPLGLPDSGNPVQGPVLSAHDAGALLAASGRRSRTGPEYTRHRLRVPNGGLRVPRELADFLDREIRQSCSLWRVRVGERVILPREREGGSLAGRSGRAARRQRPGEPAARVASADVMVAESAPHEELFPRAAAIVHQGGVGTTARRFARAEMSSSRTRTISATTRFARCGWAQRAFCSWPPYRDACGPRAQNAAGQSSSGRNRGTRRRRGSPRGWRHAGRVGLDTIRALEHGARA